MDKVVPVQVYLRLVKLLAENMLYRAKGHGSIIMLNPNSFEVWVTLLVGFFILAYFVRCALSL